MPSLHGTVITTVGRLVTQKGYDIAIEAAHILKEQGADFTWMVCGEGPERKMLEEKIGQYGLQKDFILLGVQANPYPYMKAGDIYVQTSRFEGYCLTLTEARILNRPCVATNFDVVYDQMVQGENGLVVEMTPEARSGGNSASDARPCFVCPYPPVPAVRRKGKRGGNSAGFPDSGRMKRKTEERPLRNHSR